MLEIGNPEIQNLPKNKPFIFNTLQLRTYTKNGGWYYPTDPLFLGAQCNLIRGGRGTADFMPVRHTYTGFLGTFSDRECPTTTDDLRALNTSFVSFVFQKNFRKRPFRIAAP